MSQQKVSPWEIEPFVESSVDMQQPAAKNKRPRPLDLPLAEGSAASAASPLCYPSPKQKDVSSCHSYSTSYAAGVWSSVSHVNGSLQLFQESTDDRKNGSVLASVIDYQSPVSLRASDCLDHVEGVKRFETASACRLFGIDLRKNSNKILPYAMELSSGSKSVMPSRYEADGMKNEDPLDTSIEKNNVESEARPSVKRGGGSSSRTRIKVQMQGIGVGRGVDLSALGCYEDLIEELEKMFEIRGEVGAKKRWGVVYSDNEGEMMVVGDEPWQEFCKMVRKICICSSKDVKKMKPRSRFEA